MEDTLGYKFLVENNLLERFIKEFKRIVTDKDISDYILDKGNTVTFFEGAFLWSETIHGFRFWKAVSYNYHKFYHKYYKIYTKGKEKKTLTPEFYID